jgi:hypothetical protein
VALTLPLPARVAIASSKLSCVPIVNPFLEALERGLLAHNQPERTLVDKVCRYDFVAQGNIWSYARSRLV